MPSEKVLKQLGLANEEDAEALKTIEDIVRSYCAREFRSEAVSAELSSAWSYHPLHAW